MSMSIIKAACHVKDNLGDIPLTRHIALFLAYLKNRRRELSIASDDVCSLFDVHSYIVSNDRVKRRFPDAALYFWHIWSTTVIQDYLRQNGYNVFTYPHPKAPATVIENRNGEGNVEANGDRDGDMDRDNEQGQGARDDYVPPALRVIAEALRDIRQRITNIHTLLRGLLIVVALLSIIAFLVDVVPIQQAGIIYTKGLVYLKETIISSHLAVDTIIKRSLGLTQRHLAEMLSAYASMMIRAADVMSRLVCVASLSLSDMFSSLTTTVHTVFNSLW